MELAEVTAKLKKNTTTAAVAVKTTIIIINLVLRKVHKVKVIQWLMR